MDKLENYIVRLENVVTRFEALPGVPLGGGAVAPSTPGTGGGSAQPSARAQSLGGDFKAIVDEAVVVVVQKANVIGSEGAILPTEYKEEIMTVSNLFHAAFESAVVVITAMEKCKKPHPEEMQALVKSMVAAIGDASARSDGKRQDAFNHQKAISEFLQALLFVANTAEAGKPAFHVDQSWQSAEFYANKLRKEFRTKDPKHLEWLDSLQEVYKRLKSFVVKNHPKEPVWNENGITVSEFLGTDPPTSAPPPEEPKKVVPPPKPLKATTHWQKDESKPPPSGEAFHTLKKGFQKVEPGSTPKTDTSLKPEFIGAKLKSVAPAAKEGRLELEMERKWTVEYFKGNKDIVVSDTKPRHSVYVFQCQDCVIKVEGKVNAITLEACKKTALVFEDVISMVEIINSSRTDIQCTSRVSTIAADKSDECKIIIPESCMDIELTTAKSSSITLIVAKSNAEEDPEEHPVPYQFVSKFKDGQLITEPVQHTGSA